MAVLMAVLALGRDAGIATPWKEGVVMIRHLTESFFDEDALAAAAPRSARP